MGTQTATFILTAISALGALGAAVGAWLSAYATQRATEAQLLSTLMRAYASEDMLHALRVLRNWRSNQGDEFAEKWRKALENDSSEAQEVDRARRIVSSHFITALHLYKSGYVKKRFLETICDVDGINVLYDIAEPLEYAMNPGYNREGFKTLRTLCGRAGMEHLIRPIPSTPTQREIERP